MRGTSRAPHRAREVARVGRAGDIHDKAPAHQLFLTARAHPASHDVPRASSQELGESAKHRRARTTPYVLTRLHSLSSSRPQVWWRSSSRAGRRQFDDRARGEGCLLIPGVSEAAPARAGSCAAQGAASGLGATGCARGTQRRVPIQWARRGVRVRSCQTTRERGHLRASHRLHFKAI